MEVAGEVAADEADPYRRWGEGRGEMGELVQMNLKWRERPSCFFFYCLPIGSVQREPAVHITSYTIRI